MLWAHMCLTVSERFSQIKQHTFSPRVGGCVFETSYQGCMLIKPLQVLPGMMFPARPGRWSGAQSTFAAPWWHSSLLGVGQGTCIIMEIKLPPEVSPLLQTGILSPHTYLGCGIDLGLTASAPTAALGTQQSPLPCCPATSQVAWLHALLTSTLNADLPPQISRSGSSDFKWA